jgi:CheY-like chemotaxis protein
MAGNHRFASHTGGIKAMTLPLTLLGYYYQHQGQQIGPVSCEELQRLLDTGEVLPSDEFLEGWQNGGEIMFLPHGRRLLRVLIVDAYHDAADSLTMLVKMWLHDGQVAYDEGSALTLAHAYVPDVMLLDIGLPKLAGFKFATKMLGEVGLEDMLLIAVSGHGDEKSRTHAKEMGICHYLVKPVEPSVIEDLLARQGKLLNKPSRQQSPPATSPPRLLVALPSVS